jgi:hypothetical protein
MQQRVPLVFVLEFPDEALQKDVDEALADALARMQRSAQLMTPIVGRSTVGKLVTFRFVEIDVVDLPPLPVVLPPSTAVQAAFDALAQHAQADAKGVDPDTVIPTTDPATCTHSSIRGAPWPKINVCRLCGTKGVVAR